ncbi:hypothetical protein SNEBB_004888 [Seison nebaliae]|nr:hypothetical protein SNEBB_004888 [Seison nebaliae]
MYTEDDWVDITSEVNEELEKSEKGLLWLEKGFNLKNAMSAFQVGNERMDSLMFWKKLQLTHENISKNHKKSFSEKILCNLIDKVIVGLTMSLKSVSSSNSLFLFVFISQETYIDLMEENDQRKLLIFVREVVLQIVLLNNELLQIHESFDVYGLSDCIWTMKYYEKFREELNQFKFNKEIIRRIDILYSIVRITLTLTLRRSDLDLFEEMNNLEKLLKEIRGEEEHGRKPSNLPNIDQIFNIDYGELSKDPVRYLLMDDGNDNEEIFSFISLRFMLFNLKEGAFPHYARFIPFSHSINILYDIYISQLKEIYKTICVNFNFSPTTLEYENDPYIRKITSIPSFPSNMETEEINNLVQLFHKSFRIAQQRLSRHPLVQTCHVRVVNRLFEIRDVADIKETENKLLLEEMTIKKNVVREMFPRLPIGDKNEKFVFCMKNSRNRINGKRGLLSFLTLNLFMKGTYSTIFLPKHSSEFAASNLTDFPLKVYWNNFVKVFSGNFMELHTIVCGESAMYHRSLHHFINNNCPTLLEMGKKIDVNFHKTEKAQFSNWIELLCLTILFHYFLQLKRLDLLCDYELRNYYWLMAEQLCYHIQTRIKKQFEYLNILRSTVEDMKKKISKFDFYSLEAYWIEDNRYLRSPIIPPNNSSDTFISKNEIWIKSKLTDLKIDEEHLEKSFKKLETIRLLYLAYYHFHTATSSTKPQHIQFDQLIIKEFDESNHFTRRFGIGQVILQDNYISFEHLTNIYQVYDEEMKKNLSKENGMNNYEYNLKKSSKLFKECYNHVTEFAKNEKIDEKQFNNDLLLPMFPTFDHNFRKLTMRNYVNTKILSENGQINLNKLRIENLENQLQIYPQFFIDK